jgi:hypothetical protein
MLFVLFSLLLTNTSSSDILSSLEDNDLFSFEKVWDRISQVFVIGTDRVKDASILSRYESYDHAIDVFLAHPILGGRFYAGGYVHNAWLQSASDFGLVGILTFSIPFLYLGYDWIRQVQISISSQKDYFKSEYWMVSIFVGIIFLESACMSSFHGDPYRSHFILCPIGVLIAFSRIKGF